MAHQWASVTSGQAFELAVLKGTVEGFRTEKEEEERENTIGREIALNGEKDGAEVQKKKEKKLPEMKTTGCQRNIL